MSKTDEKIEAPGGIAIVGMAGRFPGAASVDEFWTNVQNGADTVSRFDASQADCPLPDDAMGEGARPVFARGVLEDIDQFDAGFFGMLPREAAVMDPQHRMFLEICWEAMEAAGHDPARYPGSVGVFAGCYMDTYLLANLCADEAYRDRLVRSIQVGTLQTELGNDKDYLATRVAFKFGLSGPAMTVQTACSTSLVAIATACQNLEAYQCDMALAGGVTIVVPQRRGYAYREGGMLSPDGRCRPFDAAAAGTVFSNGAAVLLLKRLEDALADKDTIHAVIRGYATNNDGGEKMSYTAPSAEGQAEAISLALGMGDIPARSIGYVEAHGTATPLGDPIEVAGLTQAFRAQTDDVGFCALGSVKANLGHLDVASGAIGLIKTALCLRDGVLPPLPHFESPNPKIDFARSPFFIQSEGGDWPRGPVPRRAGVSSFGVGGTNAHVVVEEPPARRARDPLSDPGPQLLLLS
ncbi:MAG: polyketide synthase, partial [Pseudomonadota bacterium]